ncbi:MAG: hypothetical protein LBT65_05800 [Synergistaceae bacterium]|nr:hypothetical protein [Synergistaceae bacterium]
MSIVLFALALTATCTLLYAFAMPRVSESEARSAEGAGGHEAPLRDTLEAWARDLEDSAGADGNRVSASGRGRIAENTPQGRLLARRAALTDARRNLLLMRQNYLNDPKSRGVRSVSGRLAAPSQKIREERVAGDFYLLEIDVRLDELLRTDFDENFSNFFLSR